MTLGFSVRARKYAGPVALLAAATFAVPMMHAPAANAADAPAISMAVSGSAIGSADAVGTGCTVTVTATMTLPGGAPVPFGKVDFFNRVPGNGDVFLGAVPVADGKASVQWTPTTTGQNGLSAGYFDGLPDILPTATGIQVRVVPGVNLGGTCV
jgi:hypothetical protein